MECDFSKPKVEQVKWEGESAVRFSAGGYSAIVIPGIGANLIQLKNKNRNLNILRIPPDIETFRKRPQVYGIPVLFPPNRIGGGTFEAAGMVYNFPKNEPSNPNNHIHGLLRTRPWKVTFTGTTDSTASVELTFSADSNTDFYKYFPHKFDFKLNYKLSDKGLKQTAQIINHSDKPMPVGLGYHTAFNIPFSKNSCAENCRLKVTVGHKWELNDELLPTGKSLPLSTKLKKMTEEGMCPSGHSMDGLFSSEIQNINGKYFNGAVIEDNDAGVRLVYEVGLGFKHWVIWNDGGNKGFICPEPQTWMTNAPNVDLPEEISGFRLLVPGEKWTGKCKIHVEDM